MAAPIAKSDAERRKIIQDVEDLKQAKGYVSVDQACQDLGISRDVYYSYRRTLRDTPNDQDQITPAGQARPASSIYDTPDSKTSVELLKQAGQIPMVEGPGRLSIAISNENYNKLRIIAVRKAMPISAICSNILDEGIKKLE